MLKKLSFLMLVLTLGMGLGLSSAQADQYLGMSSIGMNTPSGGIGDLLLFPLYDVRVDGQNVIGRTAGSWQNLITIENTSGNWTAFHLRFRAQGCSVEVWDHVILLSPYDVFWCYLANDGEGGVSINSWDWDTLYNSGMITSIPSIPEGESPSAYMWTDYFSRELLEETGYPTADITYGHVEVIGLWQLRAPDGWPEDTHVLSDVVKNLFTQGEPAGTINVYDVLAALFYDYSDEGTPDWSWPGYTRYCVESVGIEGGRNKVSIGRNELPNVTSSGFDPVEREAIDCGNVLAGNFIMGDLLSAEMGMENFIAIENFRTTCSRDEIESCNCTRDFHRDGYAGGAIIFPPQNTLANPAPALCVYQGYNYYLNPDWATRVGPTLRDGDNGLPWGDEGMFGYDATYSMDDVEAVLAKSEVWYNYLQQEPFDSGETYTTEVTLTFPTKYLHTGFVGWGTNCEPVLWPLYECYDGFATVTDYNGAILAFRLYGTYKMSCIGPLDKPFPGWCPGKITLTATVWDADENNPPPGGPGPSPGEVTYSPTLPYETNVLFVTMDPGGQYTPNLLYSPFEMGQFRINEIRNFTTRYKLLTAPPFSYSEPPWLQSGYLPPIGVVYLRHTYGGGDFTRSALCEWHYKAIWSYGIAPYWRVRYLNIPG